MNITLLDPASGLAFIIVCMSLTALSLWQLMKNIKSHLRSRRYEQREKMMEPIQDEIKYGYQEVVSEILEKRLEQLEGPIQENVRKEAKKAAELSSREALHTGENYYLILRAIHQVLTGHKAFEPQTTLQHENIMFLEKQVKSALKDLALNPIKE